MFRSSWKQFISANARNGCRLQVISIKVISPHLPKIRFKKLTRCCLRGRRQGRRVKNISTSNCGAHFSIIHDYAWCQKILCWNTASSTSKITVWCQVAISGLFSNLGCLSLISDGNFALSYEIVKPSMLNLSFLTCPQSHRSRHSRTDYSSYMLMGWALHWQNKGNWELWWYFAQNKFPPIKMTTLGILDLR